MDMTTKLYREYKFKFYLNANHYIIINGKNGQTHPHTWEFVFYIMKSEGEFVLFNKFEKGIEEYLEKFHKSCTVQRASRKQEGNFSRYSTILPVNANFGSLSLFVII